MTAQSFLDDTALKTRYVILPFSPLFSARSVTLSVLDASMTTCRRSSAIRRPSYLIWNRRQHPLARSKIYYIMFYDDAAPSICYDAAPLTLLRLFYSTSLRYEVERSDTILRRGWPNGAARSPDLVSRGESHPIPIFFKFSRALHPNISRTAVTCSALLRTLWRRRAHR